MVDLTYARSFALEHDFDMTRPLSNDQVRDLAEYWLPDIRFHHDEYYFPIALDQMVEVVEERFSALAEAAKPSWRLTRFVRNDQGVSEFQTFDPPILVNADPSANVSYTLGYEVLAEGGGIIGALNGAEVGKDTQLTHGANNTASRHYFGANQTLSGGTVSAPGDPLLPRLRNAEDEPEVTVIASMKNLIDLLRYELLVEGDEDYPEDALRGHFDVLDELFFAVHNAWPWPRSAKRELVLEMIAAFEAGNPVNELVSNLPLGWRLNPRAWDIITRYTFLEYTFFYPYNDYKQHEDSIFANEHEGDDEGCCLVFERNLLRLAAESGDPDALQGTVPSFILTSVHEEWQGGDLFKAITAPAPGLTLDELRGATDLSVYPALGSHATYLTPGDHDLVDLGEVIKTINHKAPWLWLVPGVAITIAILAAIYDHFVEASDKTSDDGTWVQSDAIDSDAPTRVAHRVEIVPMSGEEHVYQLTYDQLLRLRGFPGKWGGHDSLVDTSPQYVEKTGRFFRKLLKSI